MALDKYRAKTSYGRNIIIVRRSWVNWHVQTRAEKVEKGAIKASRAADTVVDSRNNKINTWHTAGIWVDSEPLLLVLQ